MLEIASDRLTLQSMKKGPDEDYREYVIRWKNLASMVRPLLTNQEENSMFVDTLPSPYYDMLVVNAFVEFEDLMYFVGRIEDGIKRGKIMDIEATTFGNKKNVPNKQAEENSRQWENQSRTSSSHVPHVPKYPQSEVFHPKVRTRIWSKV